MNSSTLATRQAANALPQWRPATWSEYLADRDDPNLERVKLFFNAGYLWSEMGAEGINHAIVCNLFPILFFVWFSRTPGQKFKCMGRCQLEKANKRAAAPDQVLYIGEDAPSYSKGEPRRIDLTQWRLPDMVGEVADTTLATDLKEKKQLYAALKIPEYWVTDVKKKKVLAFRLQDDGKYQPCDYSVALEGLPISLLNETLERLSRGDHVSAALWFSQQIANLN